MSTKGPQKVAEEWRKDRLHIMTVAEGLKRQGICHVCRDLETGEVFGKQDVIHEDEVYRVVLDPYPVNPGHAILTYKPHRDDLTSLNAQEAGRIFRAVVWIARAIEAALGAEKVYLLSMPDGPSSHLVFQLVPRYEGQPMGMQLLRLPRQPLKDGAEMAGRIAGALAKARGAASQANGGDEPTDTAASEAPTEA
jgi:diadenosine tetraphosphate (Ap4A) HIT family hydrolase